MKSRIYDLSRVHNGRSTRSVPPITLYFFNMPYLELMVNVQVPDSEERALALEFSKLSAETLGKPEAYISVSITYNKTLTFGGTFDPAFQLTIMSLDNFDLEANERYSAAFSEFFKEKLNIPNDRG